MTLDPSYLEYAKRRPGYDHDLYDYAKLPDRKPLNWPKQKSVATWIVVSLEWFPITPSDVPFRAPGHMQTAYPDFRHYTSREYGTRVGFYRMLDAFAKIGAKVSVAANAEIAKRYPSIIHDIVAEGHEIIAHSTDMNGTIATGLPTEAYFDRMWNVAEAAPNPFAGDRFDNDWLASTVARLNRNTAEHGGAGAA